MCTYVYIYMCTYMCTYVCIVRAQPDKSFLNFVKSNAHQIWIAVFILMTQNRILFGPKLIGDYLTRFRKLFPCVRCEINM